ncbi:hypothetical protein [Rhodoplanes elegans]|uniref:hypothetical protein n=1 Tax=Rhodoplanes elegans TaxID=29408 RepID=UPI0011B93F54|nr:hypothetical protein [Rhodoplanes elegans]
MSANPMQVAQEIFEHCWRDLTPDQWDALDALGNKAFREDQERRSVLLGIASQYRNERIAEKDGTPSEHTEKAILIGRLADELARSLRSYPRWVSFIDQDEIVGHDAEDRQTRSRMLRWAYAAPSMLELLAAGAKRSAIGVDLVEVEKSYLRALRLSSNAKDWPAARMYWLLFSHMKDRWRFRVYETKNETPATRFVAYFVSAIDPVRQPTLKQISRAIADFKRAPILIGELERLRSAVGN